MPTPRQIRVPGAPRSKFDNSDTRHQRVELRPLPLRITQHQWERLNEARDWDNLPIQEHVRRALDYYLLHLEELVKLEKEGRAARGDKPESAGKTAVQSTTYSPNPSTQARAQTSATPPLTARAVLERALKPKVGVR